MEQLTVLTDQALYGRLLLFLGVSRDSVESYLRDCHEVSLKEGEILLAPGKENTNLFVILEGSLAIHLDSPDKDPLITFTAGECVGEMSIIDSMEASAYVVSNKASRLLVIRHDILWAMVGASHGVSRNLLYILARRLRYGNNVIIDSIEMQRHIQQIAMIDSLTGLHNRRWLDEILPRQMRRTTFDKEPFTIIMLDVDRFKVYNDTHGHLAADCALRAISSVLRDNLRPTDMVARYGGEEFVVMLPRTSGPNAIIVAERLRVKVSEAEVPDFGGVSLPSVTISLGIAEMLAEGQSHEELLAAADAALYKAKEGGRNRYHLQGS